MAQQLSDGGGKEASVGIPQLPLTTGAIMRRSASNISTGHAHHGSGSIPGLAQLQAQHRHCLHHPETPDHAHHHGQGTRLGLPPHRRSVSAERGAWVSSAQPKGRDRERFIRLPLTHEEQQQDLLELQPPIQREPSETLFPILPPPQGLGQVPITGPRITCSVVCEAFEREEVFTILSDAFPQGVIARMPEVIHLSAYLSPTHDRREQEPLVNSQGQASDVFVFDYGVMVCWGLRAQQEHHILTLLTPCKNRPLSGVEQQKHREELGLQYAGDQPPHIQNDTITLPRLEAGDSQVKMAISHALAQSCKLSLYESRMAELSDKVRYLPESLAKYGEIKMSRKQMASIKGQVFILKSEVNLLSTVLDTPDFFWDVPDALRVLYDKVCQYVELQERVDLVNSRTTLIQRMLRIWSNHMEQGHSHRLDRIVVILVFLEVILAALQIYAMIEGGPLRDSRAGRALAV